MPGCVVCRLCDSPGTLEAAKDIARVPCHVRAFQEHEFTVWRCSGCGSLHSAEEPDQPAFYSAYPLQRQRIDASDAKEGARPMLQNTDCQESWHPGVHR